QTVAGCPVPPPPARGRNGVAGEPSLRPNLPGVDPRVVAALEKVLAESEAKRPDRELARAEEKQPRVVIVVEEQQEAREPARASEIAEPFVIERAKELRLAGQAMKASRCPCELPSADDCLGLLKTVVEFRFSIVLSGEGRPAWALSYGLLGWS